MSSAALAQPVQLPAPPNAVWATPEGPTPATAPTPDAACRLQHAYYNPGAVYLDPVKIEGRDDAFGCRWLAAQHPGGSGDTVLPAWVFGYCADGAYFRNGQCFDARIESPECICPDGGVLSQGPTPLLGDPISVTTGSQLEQETDFATADGKLDVTRNYSSSRWRPDSEGHFGFGSAWSGLIPGRLMMAGWYGERVQYSKGNGGAMHSFMATNVTDLNSWTFRHDSFTSARLTMENVPTSNRSDFRYQYPAVNGPPEFRLQKANGEHILFRRAGTSMGTGRYAVPVEQGRQDGYRIFYDYPDLEYYPNRIRDTDGRQLLLTWRAAPLPGIAGNYVETYYKVIEKIVLPDNSELHYDYDNANTIITGSYSSTGHVTTQISLPGPRDRLISVRRKTATGTVLWGRDYLYQNGRFPYALTGIKDADGNQLSTFTYDAAGQSASSEMAGGVLRYTMENLYWDNNSVDRLVTNPLGRVERYATWRNHPVGLKDVPRALARIEGAATATVPADMVRFEYEAPSEGYVDSTLTAIVNRENVRTEFDVDMAVWRRPNAIIEAKGRPEQRQTDITYWPDRNLPASITRGSLRTDFTYTSGGQLLTQTQTDLTTQTIPYATSGQSRAISYAWNANGRLDSVNGPLPVNAQGKDDITSFAYDASGNLQTSTNALGHVTAFSLYDSNGRPGKATDPNGIVIEFGYDPLGRMTSMIVKDPLTASGDAITGIEYDAEGRVTGITRPATDKLIMDYNLAGQMTAIRAVSGERIDFTYNAAGGVTSQTVKRADATTARSITRTFDSLNRMLTETLGLGRTTTWAYDKEGNPTQVLTARNNATVLAFDGLNRLMTTTLPGGGAEELDYTKQDDVESSSDALSVTTNFTRNGFGEVIQEISPDRGTSVYHYDAAGRLSAVIDGRGQRVDYARDILGRVTSKTPVGRPAAEVVSYAYDDATLGPYQMGRLSRMVDHTGMTTTLFDHRGNLATKRQPVGTATGKLVYSYDHADRITQITYPSGRLVEYLRDSKGRVSTIRTKATAATTAWTNVATAMTYEAFGSLKQATLGNTLSMTNNWGNDGRLASRRLYVTSSGVNRSLLSYAYDNDDNITGITDGVTANRSLAHTYDARGRLTRTVAQTGTYRREDYLHDANGNRTSVERRTTATATAAAQTDAYTRSPGTNRLASVTSFAGTRIINYDARGNTISEARPAAATVSASYDGHARLISYSRTGEAAQANAYNGFDERVTVTSGTTIRRFVYDPDGRVIGEYGTGPTNVIAERIWMTPELSDGGMFGGDDGTGGYAPIALVVGTTLRYVHGNHLGVPALYTSNTGAAIATPAYTLPGFPGQYRTYADLYYNKYRDYDTSTGRYIQADPIGLAGGASPYSYALGNPVRYTDRDGLIVDTVIDIGSVLYDLYRIGKDNIFGDNCDPDSLRTNLTALGLDLGAMVVPFVTGLGAGSRVARNADDVEDLIKAAQQNYPKKAGIIENHHITPKYLGGAKNGPTAPIDAAYHQEITNAFRNEHGYGHASPSAARLNEIMQSVYQQLPLPPKR